MPVLSSLRHVYYSHKTLIAISHPTSLRFPNGKNGVNEVMKLTRFGNGAAVSSLHKNCNKRWQATKDMSCIKAKLTCISGMSCISSFPLATAKNILMVIASSEVFCLYSYH